MADFGLFTFPSGAQIYLPLHSGAHGAGGVDPIKLDDLAAPDDNTDLNASTTKHGLLLKLGGGTANFLRADGTWAAPAGGAPAAHATTHQNGGSDEVNVDGLSGQLADAQKITVRKNSGANVGTRPRLNFIQGSGCTITVADSGLANEIQITISVP